MKEFHVFVSYSRKDDTYFHADLGKESPIDIILNRFKKEGLIPWIDREGKYCGAAFAEEITKALSKSELVLYISSKNSNDENSKWVFREIIEADTNNMKIIPLLIDGSAYNSKISMIFNGIDRIEYYKDPKKGLNDLVAGIKAHLAKIKQLEKEKAAAEEAERIRIAKEKEKAEKEKAEKERIKKLEKDIENIKRSIARYVEKQQSCMKELLSKERDLNRSSIDNHECPVCQTPISEDMDFCDICGWHFATPKELVSSEMHQMYEERLHASRAIWTEKQQKNKEIESLKKQNDTLTTKKDEIEKELADYRNKYSVCLEDGKKQIQTKQAEIKKLENELKEAKSQFSKAQQKISELSKKNTEPKIAFSPSKVKQPIAFLLVTEFDQTNVYCLYEGKNSFGAMQAAANQTDYQMLVVSDNNLNARHFEIDVYRENKRFAFSVSPNNESCILSLNSPSNVIKADNNIQINDMLFIGEVKIQIIDNFNKSI